MVIMSNEVSPLKKTERIASIDRFRGIVIFCMIIFQFAEHFPALGAVANFAKHAPSEDGIYILPNLSIADLVAPMFILAIGLTYVPSLSRRIERFGKKQALTHFVQRYLTLIGIGIVMNGINDILDGKFDEPLCIMFIALTALVLVFAIVGLILKIAKVKKRSKYYKFLGAFVSFVGVVGLAVAIINAIMFVAGKTASSYGHWLVLHHIGLAGLIALPFAMLKGKKGNYIRLACGVGLLALFAIFHETDLPNDLFASNLALVDEVADGGFIGGFAWGAMLIIYLFFAEEFKNRKNKLLPPPSFLVYAAVTAAVIIGVYKTLPAGTTTYAGALSSFLPINKGSESPSFIIITGFISLFAYYIFDLFNFYKLKFDPLAWWGKNPILMYCIEFGFVGAVNVALEDFFENASYPVSALIVFAMTALLTFVAYILDKKKIIIKL